MLVFDLTPRSAYSLMKRIFRGTYDGNSKGSNEAVVEPVIVESEANAAATTMTSIAPRHKQDVDYIRQRGSEKKKNVN